MFIRTYNTAESMLESNGDWLEQHEAMNNMLLGFLLQQQSRGNAAPSGEAQPIYYAVRKATGPLIAAAIRPDRMLIVSSSSEGEPEHAGIRLLAHFIHHFAYRLSGFSGPRKLIAAFAETWGELSRESVHLEFEQGVYELRQVNPVSLSNQGCLRLADRQDLRLVADWMMHSSRKRLAPRSPLRKRWKVRLHRSRRHRCTCGWQARRRYPWRGRFGRRGGAAPSPTFIRLGSTNVAVSGRLASRRLASNCLIAGIHCAV